MNAKSLKVMHVIDSGGLYGAEKILLSLMQAHCALDVESQLGSIGLPGESEKAIEAEADRMGLPWQRFALRTGPDIKGMTGLVREAAADGVSLIHSHGYKANTLLAALSRRSRTLAVVATLHGWVSAGRPGRMKIYEWAECVLLPRLDRVVAVSHDMIRRTLLAQRMGSRLTVIHNGINNSIPATRERTSSVSHIYKDVEQFIGDASGFVMVGRLSAEKDIPAALQAFSALAQSGENAKLVIFGQGPEQSALEALSQSLQIQQDVWFYGYCDCIADILPLFRALLISSRTEGIPLVALEAMRAGLPIIATEVGGLPEVVVPKETGMLVTAGNTGQLADAIRHLSQDSELARRLGVAGSERLKIHFTIQRVAHEYRDAYRSTI